MRKSIAIAVIAFSLGPGTASGLSGGAGAPTDETARPVRSLIEERHRNLVLQQWELSCAAAALATILRYQYGVPVTERSVALSLINREEYIANPELVRLRQGFSLLDLKRFVDALGYEGIGLGQLAFFDLLERAPIIVPVYLRGYPHFVVFRGATSERVLLADPAFGNVTMSIHKFVNGWIDYKDIGRVGFVVTKSGKLASPGRLSARALDFVVLR
ncbi:MAG: C39 family peptidase [Betaproteobacteria bacterium]|nr:C39 family peptidase [Betaproteobacteria bacterium]